MPEKAVMLLVGVRLDDRALDFAADLGCVAEQAPSLSAACSMSREFGPMYAGPRR